MIGEGLLVLVAATSQSVAVAERDKVFRAQLDRDAPLEQVRKEVRRCREYSTCSRLVVVDDGRRAILTPLTQRPEHPYGWTIQDIRLVDFTGDGIKELAYELMTAGATASSPQMTVVGRWDGRRERRIFAFTDGRPPARGFAWAQVTVTEIVERREGLPEIRSVEGLFTGKGNEGTCCPSGLRYTRHRWNGRRIAPVSVRVEKN